MNSMPSMFNLTGKVAVVTGGSRGIGLAIAQALAGAGAKLVITARKADGLQDAANSLRESGAEVLALTAHNGDKDQLQTLIQQTVEAYGGVDILVNNAATNPHFGPILEAEDSMWQKTIEVNLLGNIWLCQQVVPMMRSRGGGKIINIASINGIRPGRMQGVYSTTKAAVINLTQTLAMELAPDNIQCNAIAPGLVQTKFARAIWENDMLMDLVLSRTPAQRTGQPDDIAGIALYLASPASAFTTGQVFVIDGGVSIPMI
ncbi:MAG: glucose 1-dehydrogenase [Anaerolineae bacterium]|nr:glucose 1-dehydrogenase [Anaerolineae bacterium]